MLLRVQQQSRGANVPLVSSAWSGLSTWNEFEVAAGPRRLYSIVASCGHVNAMGALSLASFAAVGGLLRDHYSTSGC